jgi:hypothetical protein
MKISKTHQRFADRLNDQRALDYPEEFLGPNWREVLNFWLYLDDLSTEQLDIFRDLYWKLEVSDKDFSCFFAYNAACGVASMLIANQADMAAPGSACAVATLELIGAHKILEQGKELKIIQLFLDSFKTDP